MANNPKLLEIEKRLRAAQDSGSWKYEPEHPMFVGTTNALAIYELGMIDLGRTRKPSKNENEEDKRTRELIQGLGVFLENCREDMAWLIARVRNLENENARLREALESLHHESARISADLSAPNEHRVRVTVYDRCND